MSEDMARLVTVHPCDFPRVMCSTLADVVEVNRRSAGLSLIETTSFTDGSKRLLGVAYKARPRDRGVFLNTCPWCGGSLRAALEAAIAAGEVR